MNAPSLPATEIATAGPRPGHAFSQNVAAAPVIAKQIVGHLTLRRRAIEAVRVIALPDRVYLVFRVPDTDLFHIVEAIRDEDDEQGRPRYLAEVLAFSYGPDYDRTASLETPYEPLLVYCPRLDQIGGPVAAALDRAYRVLFKSALNMSKRRMRLSRDGWEYLGQWGFCRNGRRAYVWRGKTDYTNVSRTQVEAMRAHYRGALERVALTHEEYGLRFSSSGK